MILSYSGFEDEAHTLLHTLCRNSRLYSKSHAQLLRSFLRVDFAKLRLNCLELTETFDVFDEDTGMYTQIGPIIEIVEIIRSPDQKGKFELTNKQLTYSHKW